MSSPYSVWVNTAGDHRFIDVDTLGEALRRAQKVPKRRDRIIRVVGDGYDCDFEYGRGYYECDDGLTEAERAKVERMGFGR